MPRPAARAVVSFVLVLLVAASVEAVPVTFLEQSRSVRAEASASDSTSGNIVTVSDMIAAPDFADFEAAVDASVILPFAQADADAWQSSRITPTSITAHGTANGSESRDPADLALAEISVSSFFSLTFELAEPTPYDLSVDLGLIGMAEVIDSSGAVVMIEGPDEFLFFADLFLDDPPSLLHVSEEGVFAPGVYNVFAFATVSPWHETISAMAVRTSFAIDLVLPEPSTLVMLTLAGLPRWSRRRTARFRDS